MTKEVSIYGLLDPRTNRVHYVGQAVDPQKRYRSHLHNPPNMAAAAWLNELKAAGLKPLLSILEAGLIGASAGDAEVRWIRRGLSEGWPLTNKKHTPSMTYNHSYERYTGPLIIRRCYEPDEGRTYKALTYLLSTVSQGGLTDERTGID